MHFGQLEEIGPSQGASLQVQSISYRNPLDVFSRLYGKHNCIFLLESIEGSKKLAEFSFIGFSPKKMITVKRGEARLMEGSDAPSGIGNDPLGPIRDEVDANRVRYGQFRLVGGAVGYISYDTVRYWEKLPGPASDDLDLPDVEMGIYADGIVFNHVEKRAYYYHSGENRLGEVERCLRGPAPEGESLSFSEPVSNMSKEDFERAVVRAKEYISEGDIFQVVLSKRYDLSIRGNLINFYRALREINPSPYMYFLKHGERQIVGSSPEMLMRVEGGAVETYPIAGTRPVSDDPVKNKALSEELLADPKERAEHVMLVDLARNDIGRISEYGSVSVPEFMTVHQFSHVQHIVSRVVGRLSPDYDCFDAMEAMLPAGTLSGAPKVRAMEIIDELERARRGPYAGAVGHFSFNGSADFAITIRTLVAQGDRAYIQVGAGIVADSVPEREWFETEQKAGALMKALRKACERP